MTLNSDEPVKQPLFHPIDAEDPGQMPTSLESLCINCEEQGVTRLLLTKIPFYKDVVLMSFQCEHCGYRNCEIQSTGQCQEMGLKLVLKVENERDLNRQIVKSEYAGVTIPEISLEIPCGSQKGEITTVEGIITRVIESLGQRESYREVVETEKISDFVTKAQRLLTGAEPFTLILDDPSGDSAIENPNQLQMDHQVTTIHYHRTLDQNKLLALVADDATEEPESSCIWDSKEAVKDEVLNFNTNCPSCGSPAQTHMKFVGETLAYVWTERRIYFQPFIHDLNIPHFKEAVIMATSCDVCGEKTNEFKSGGGVSEKGTKLTLLIEKPEDLTRDVLKSETCSISIPELEFESGMGGLGGRFSTVEGIVTAIIETLTGESNFSCGDSADSSAKGKMDIFIEKLKKLSEAKLSAHLVLDDPAGNSYIQSLTDSNCDERLKIEKYERSYEQNEELGLNDLKVENYESQ